MPMRRLLALLALLTLPVLAARGSEPGLAAPQAAGEEVPSADRARRDRDRPNIVFILADDLGWSDVGFNGSEIPTPHIDSLARDGVRLNQHYVLPLCSPTRSALLTGRHPYRMGMQTGVVRWDAQYGLPLTERTLAQALRESGYETALAGKWHLGHFAAPYLPTQRGFEHQYGHLHGAIDYWTHTNTEGDRARDWYRNDQPLREEGYSTCLIAEEAVRRIDQKDPQRPLFLYLAFNAPHGPVQAPAEYLERFAHLPNSQRRRFAACVAALDDAIGSVLAALERTGQAENTVVVFTSDNGALKVRGGTNGSLRGEKRDLYEGGVRVPAVVRWPAALPTGKVVERPVHVTDWYPSLLQVAGAEMRQSLPVDGEPFLRSLARGEGVPGGAFVLNVEAEKAAVRKGDWKLVVQGRVARRPDRNQQVELFQLARDPGEAQNEANERPAVVKELWEILDLAARQSVPAMGRERD